MRALALTLTFLLMACAGAANAGDNLSFSAMFEMAKAGKVRAVKVVGEHSAKAILKDGSTRDVALPPVGSWAVDFAKSGVDVDFSKMDDPTPGEIVGRIFALVAPILMLFIATLMVLYLWRTIGRGSKPGEFIPRGKVDTKFVDVIGADEAKSALEEVVAYLKDPFAFQRLGGRARRGILLVGDPGNGKTMLARAVAGEANVPFYATSGSDFQEMFAGLGARRIRTMFKELRKKKGKGSVVLFIDEFDSLGRRRSDQSSPVQDDAAATLNQLLKELDGILPSQGIVLIAATNRPDVLDPAAKRPGRIDLQVVVQPPNQASRRGILESACRKLTLSDDVDLGVMARGTPGFSGADLVALVNEAALRATRGGGEKVVMRDFEWARDTKILGGDRPGLSLVEDEGLVVAYHESGHALVSVLEPECDPIHKATVVPRGRALGFVASLPEFERVLGRKSKMKAEITKLMAGRAAEEVKFGTDAVTSGASSDIEEATKMARLMVGQLGFGSTMASRALRAGPLETAPYSQRTMERLDDEVEALISECYARAKGLVERNRAALDALVDAFTAADTLSGKDIVDIVEANRAREAA